jgi:hypothetical protein
MTNRKSIFPSQPTGLSPVKSGGSPTSGIGEAVVSVDPLASLVPPSIEPDPLLPVDDDDEVDELSLLSGTVVTPGVVVNADVFAAGAWQAPSRRRARAGGVNLTRAF